MRWLKNIDADRVIDLVLPKLKAVFQLDVVRSALSLFAFADMQAKLNDLKLAQLILPASGSDLGFLGGQADCASRNKLRSHWLAKRCAEQALSLSKPPRISMHALYQGWMDIVLALQAAYLTGSFLPSLNEKQGAERHQALQDVKRLQAEIVKLRAVASKDKQLARQVELNIEIEQLERREVTALAFFIQESK